MKRRIFSIFFVLVLVLSMSLVMAAPVSAQGALAGVSATPADATETVTTTYTIGFTTATAGNVKFVDMLFDSNFDVSGVGGTATVSGIGAGTVTYDANTVTYTVTDTALIPAGRAITIALSDIQNPDVAGDYEPAVTVTTKNPAEGAIDTGSANVTITPKPVSFEVVAETVTVGEAFSVTITAKDAAAGGGNTVVGYAGDHLIDFTCGGTGSYPDFEVINFANGIGISSQSFILTVVGEANVEIEAVDTPLGVTGTSEAITINPAAALVGFTIDAPVTATAGAVFGSTVTVTAIDANDYTVTDYTGTVTWSSTDPIAELPADYTFIAGDNGVKIFAAVGFTLKTVLLEEGTPIDTTITITDESAGVSKESTGITVGPADAASLTVTAAPTSIRADGTNESTITATAYDQFGNVDTKYNGADYTVTFSTSLGTVATGAVDPASGVATDTLTSDEVGVATIKVEDTDQGNLAYATTTVELVAPSVRTAVWVAPPPTGNDANSGTEAEPFATIQVAIDAVAEGGTVTVGGGTYNPQAGAPGNYTVIVVDKALTLQAAAGSTPVIIPVRLGENSFRAIRIVADNVTIDGFTIVDSAFDVGGADYGISVEGAWENFVIQNNTITGFGNTDDVYENCIGIKAMNCHLTGLTSGLIKNNTLEANRDAIQVANSEYVTIQGNLCQSNRNGIALYNSTDITVIENKVYSSTNDGLYVSSDSSGTFNRNDIADNIAGFTCDATVTMDAENNWWGNATGPTHVSNPSGTGDTVSNFVNFTPWLTAPYAEPVDPVAPVTTIELSVGWNLISLMLIPEDPLIEVVLADLIADVTVDQVRTYQAGVWSGWGAPFDVPLTDMDAGVGFWVNMDSPDTLVVTGYELCEPAPAVPPEYSVVVGWNLIGFKFTTPGTIDGYLGDVNTNLDAIYGYVDGAYFIPTTLEPGLGYWIAVTLPGTIYPNLVSP